MRSTLTLPLAREPTRRPVLRASSGRTEGIIPVQNGGSVRVMQKTAMRRNQHAPADPPDLEPWHTLFHWLKYHGKHRVYIPYAGYLASSATASAVRMRRDFGTLLGMIEAHAITHQLTRARDEHGRIIATAADYEAAREILAEAFAVSSGKKVKDSVRRAVAAVDELGGEKADVTVAQVAKHLKRDRTRVTRGLKEAAENAYLVNMEDRAGRAARYRLGPDQLPEDAPALPEKLPNDVCMRTPAQPAHLSPQVKDGCAPVRGVRGDADRDAVQLILDVLGGEVIGTDWPEGTIGADANPTA